MKRLDTFYIVQKYFTGPNLFAADKDDLSTYVSHEGKEIPSQEQIDAKIEEVKAEWKAEEWKRKRQSNYPDIGDQLDALYHAGLFPKEMADKLKAVKEKYPKSELKDGN